VSKCRSCIVEKLQESFIGEALQFARNAAMNLNAIHLLPKYACRQSSFPERRRQTVLNRTVQQATCSCIPNLTGSSGDSYERW
jgi:hypothetical protein